MSIKFIVTCIALTAACTTATVQEAEAGRIRPNPESEVLFVKRLLNILQRRSIAENREYCGYIGIVYGGDLTASVAVAGDVASCLPESPDPSMHIIASYHTHGAYSDAYDNEVPSIDDLRGDIEEELNGYVATPGGRLWFSDGRAQSIRMVCDVNCIYSDPNFRPDPDWPVEQTYSLNQLIQRQE